MSLTSQAYRHHFCQLVNYNFPEHYINALRHVIGGEIEEGRKGGREGGREGGMKKQMDGWTDGKRGGERKEKTESKLQQEERGRKTKECEGPWKGE